MTQQLLIKYAPGPVATEFHRDKTSRVKLLIGPFGTGKTTSCAWDIIDFQADRIKPLNGKRKSRFAIIRNTYPELTETTMRTYLDWFPPMAFGNFNESKKKYNIFFEDKEIELLFKALDEPKAVRDLLSLDLTGAHVDETREIHQDVVKGLLGRIGRYPSMKDYQGINPFLSPPQVILSTNYPPTTHYLYRDFFEKQIEGYSMYRMPQSENAHNLPPFYYQNLEKDYADRPDLLRTLVHGEWGITVKGKKVYPEFSRDLHVSPFPLHIEDSKIIRGWDNTGLNPACVITQTGPTGQWKILKEFCGHDIGIMDFGEMVLLWCREKFGWNAKYKDIGDPAGKNRDSTKTSPHDYLRKLGIRIEDGIQTFKIRREAVAGQLNRLINQAPAIVIDPSCTMLIDGFDGGYAYPEIGNTGVFKTEPQKPSQYADIHDALQYPATRLFARAKREESGDNISSISSGRSSWMAV